MSYRDLFSAINCQYVIFFEDGFEQVPFKKEQAMYDIVRMNMKDRKLYLSKIKEESEEVEEKISIFLEMVDRYFDKIGSWNDNVTSDDITTAFSSICKCSSEDCEKIEKMYEMLAVDDLRSVYDIGAKYGIGVSYPTQYDAIFKEYILLDNRKKSLRVYTNYSSRTAELFAEDIGSLEDANCAICIIDNQLGEEKRANEIIQDIKKFGKSERMNIVGCVFSSQGAYEEIDSDVYFEYASKENIANLEGCLARSAYSYYLSVLEKKITKGIRAAFKTAQKNKGIAYYLSQKAQKEGESEYQIINDWIQLLAVNAQMDTSNIKHLIALSRVINSLSDSMDEPDDFLQQLNTWEAFDYRINEYLLPVAAGDIFVDDNDNWYVLVGQDCDMARSIKRHPKNAVAELLPAKIRQQTDFKKYANDLEKASIYNFKKSISDHSEILQVDYTKREFLANEIIDLCAYNTDGNCKISLTQSLNDEQIRLLPQHMIEYYSTLKKYFSSIKEIKTMAGEAFDIINGENHSNRLIQTGDFKEDDNQIAFGLRRVCRLTHTYVFYLYKLYLEYRGRQPFQTINLVRVDEVTLPVYTDENQKTEHSCSLRRIENPNPGNPKNWCWMISKAELTRVLSQLAFGMPDIADADEDIMLVQVTTEMQLKDGKQLIIKKERDKIKFKLMQKFKSKQPKQK